MRFHATNLAHSVVLFGAALLAAMVLGSAIIRVGADLIPARRASLPPALAAQVTPTTAPDRAPEVALGATEGDEITAPAELGLRSQLPLRDEHVPQSRRDEPASFGSAALPRYEPMIDESFTAPSGDWPARDEPTWQSSYVDGRYRIELMGRSSLNLFRALPVEQCRISVDVSVHGGGAGLIFLLSHPNTLYRIMLSADGTYALFQQRGDEVVTLIDWTPSDALRAEVGATYHLTVERRERDVAISVDGRPLTTWAVPDAPTTQQYGLAITSRYGVAEASFDNLMVEVPVTP